jgi:hypothetical protein
MPLEQRENPRVGSTAWHAEAKHLRAQGRDLKAIAATLGRPPPLARWALPAWSGRWRRLAL